MATATAMATAMLLARAMVTATATSTATATVMATAMATASLTFRAMTTLTALSTGTSTVTSMATQCHLLLLELIDFLLFAAITLASLFCHHFWRCGDPCCCCHVEHVPSRPRSPHSFCCLPLANPG